MLKDKVLVVYVTRNNPVLLQHALESFSKYSAGYDYDLLIVDNQSDNKQQLSALENLAKKHKVVTYDNNRVEVSFDRAYQENKDYAYYFFLHDDCVANRDDWLKVFITRQKSRYIENIVQQDATFVDLPIGRVGAAHQPWRNYASILGYPVQCFFLEHAIRVLNQDSLVPKIFKFCDPDRVLVTNECLEATGGIINVDDFKKMKENKELAYDKLCKVLSTHLQYHDEGMYPIEKYPPGECWNKLTLASEFLNSVDPLICGYRTVGLEGDGCLEQIHGYDEPWGHNYVHHYGSPNMRQFLAKVFNTDANEIKKSYNSKVFLIKSDKAIKDYFLRRS